MVGIEKVGFCNVMGPIRDSNESLTFNVTFARIGINGYHCLLIEVGNNKRRIWIMFDLRLYLSHDLLLVTDYFSIMGLGLP